VINIQSVKNKKIKIFFSKKSVKKKKRKSLKNIIKINIRKK
jgi:hypothetical protein